MGLIILDLANSPPSLTSISNVGVYRRTSGLLNFVALLVDLYVIITYGKYGGTSPQKMKTQNTGRPRTSHPMAVSPESDGLDWDNVAYVRSFLLDQLNLSIV